MKMLLNLGLLVLSTLAALLIAEGLIRLAAPQQLILIRPDIWMPVDSFGWKHRPNISTQVNTGEREVDLFTDSDGFRVGEAGRQSAQDTILLIGDSFMAALQVPYEQSLAGLLEERLRVEGGGVAVRNMGVGAWDAPHYLIAAKERLAHGQRSYDLLLVAVFVNNDVVPRRVEAYPPRHPVERYEFRLPRSLAADELVNALARPLNDFLEVRSHLFILARTAMAPLRIKAGLSAVYIPDGLRKDRASHPSWEVTADILADVHAMAQRSGTPTLFVLLPSNYQVNREIFRRHAAAFDIDTMAIDLDQPNRILDRELRERGLPVVDALPGFREARSRGLHLYGSVDPHLSPEGHAVLYRILAGPVETLLARGGDPAPQTD